MGLYMNSVGKLKKSWWAFVSFILALNGLGFVYIGSKYNNKGWIYEGIIYEVPWILALIFSYDLKLCTGLVIIALMVMIVSIIRSIWVAVKLLDIYENQEKYSVRPTVVTNPEKPKDDDNFKTSAGCCLCLIAVFLLFIIIAL